MALPFNNKKNLNDRVSSQIGRRTLILGHKTKIISSPEPKAHGELIVYQSSRRPSVRACVRLFILSNMIISTTSRPIPTKFYLKHHWGGGKAALCFGPDRIGTLVSMATDSSHRVKMGEIS